MFPMINKKRTGLRLKSLLEERGLTPGTVQEYLSLACVQTVYRWLEGINIPCIDHLYALSVLLDVRLDELIVGDRGRERREMPGEGEGRESSEAFSSCTSCRGCRVYADYEKYVKYALCCDTMVRANNYYLCISDQTAA